MSVINKPLTNLQLELIKLFRLELSEEELLQVKRMLTQYLANRASDEMDKLWEENNWTNETMDQWLKGEDGK